MFHPRVKEKSKHWLLCVNREKLFIKKKKKSRKPDIIMKWSINTRKLDVGVLKIIS